MAGHTDIPLSATTCVSPFALEIVSDALLFPSATGWNETETLVDDPAFTVVEPGTPTLKSAAFEPETANGVDSVTDEIAWLAIVTVAPAVEPRATEPKSIGLGNTANAGVMTLARFCGVLGAMSWKSLALSFVSTPLPFAPPGFRS
jgi:hypothetical protein